MSNWYSAVLLLVAEVPGRQADALCELSVRLVDAADEAAAWQRAAELGREAEHAYENGDGALVQWRFDRVVELQQLDEAEAGDGMEVFSSMFRRARSSLARDLHLTLVETNGEGS